jgi:hypothetical protein
MKKIYRGIVENNTLKIYEKEEFKKLIQSFNGKEVAITLEKYFKNRSVKENNYYRGCVLETIKEYTGDDKDSLHIFLKQKFLKERGNICDKIKSTKTLTTVQFEKYLSDIRMWASQELSLYIFLPGEYEQSIYS